jgi:cholesterol oxidase
MRDSGELSGLSPKLGELTRTNSEAITGANRPSVDPTENFSAGVAITSSIHPDDHTHIEPVRYGPGSNAMGLLQTLATDGDSDVPRWKQFLSHLGKHPVKSLQMFSVRRWSERTVILLVMQSVDNSLTTFTKRGLLGRRMTSKQGHGEPNPAFIPAAYKATELAAEHMDGQAGGTWGELFNIPLTAHFIGGCPIGSTTEEGVIDPYHRAFGYPTLSIVDGSAITANLGVNPSLTIAAQAERAFSMWPNLGETDRRPSQDSAYVPIAAIAPKSPVVPADAPAALRTA